LTLRRARPDYRQADLTRELHGPVETTRTTTAVDSRVKPEKSESMENKLRGP
jgi:hypothetical protein